MKTRFNCRISSPLRQERGGVTLEAAFLLPVGIVIALAALFAVIGSFQSSLTYIAASVSADRIAHRWDHSEKHPITGMYSTFARDPLYWRWSHNGAPAWFGLFGGDRVTTVRYPASEDESSGDLVEKKLASGATDWPIAYRGIGEFRSGLFANTVAVTAAVPISAPRWLGTDWPKHAAGASSETVTEPAEFIRNVALVVGYLPFVKSKLEGDTVKNTYSRWFESTDIVPIVDRDLAFGRHADAVKYLRALVHGKERRIPTQETGKWRLIDAMDNQGVAHQTYIGKKNATKDMLDQMRKDAELIRRGEVTGVVWHFFRRTGETSAGPSGPLKRELQKHGIIVVVHS